MNQRDFIINNGLAAASPAVLNRGKSKEITIVKKTGERASLYIAIVY